MNRRRFLKTSGAGVAGVLAARPLFANAASNNPIGANSDIRVGVIGFRSHGRSHIRAYQSMSGVRLAGLCDVDEEVLQRQVRALDKDGIKVKGYRDLRALLDNPDIDAVSIATPNHWHALATVWACQAGKHVCVEKPVSHSIWEGRKMVEAARKHGRMVQADLDRRSHPELDEAFAYLQSGELGKIGYARAWDYKRRKSIGKIVGPQDIPGHIDYNLWTGPAAMRPLLRENLHYDWHWQWATGNGEIGNNGPHQLDQVRWALGKGGLPKTVASFGGRFGYVDDGQTPNTQVALYDYDGIPVIYEARGLPESADSDNMDGFVGETVTGNRVTHPHNRPSPNDSFAIFCEGGYYHDGVIYDNDGKEIKRFAEPSAKGPQANFVAALRSGKREDLKTDILEGHLSTCLCHMGNASIMSGEPKSFEQARRDIPANNHSEMAFDRMYLHLKANGIKMGKRPVIVGPVLTMDSDKEQFVGRGSEHGNLFIKDTYREPFVIRDQV
jgi:predicted dehydrogenase